METLIKKAMDYLLEEYTDEAIQKKIDLRNKLHITTIEAIEMLSGSLAYDMPYMMVVLISNPKAYADMIYTAYDTFTDGEKETFRWFTKTYVDVFQEEETYVN